MPRTTYTLCFSTISGRQAMIHGGCSKSNASYFIMLAHNIRGRCWWYGSRSWTFSPIFHFILLPWDRWQQRGRLTKWGLTWKCVWSKGVSLNSSVQKKQHLININWLLLYTDGGQKVYVSTVKQWVVHFSSGDSDSGSPPLMQIDKRAACRLLFTAGENA